MYPELIPILQCPTCGSPLALTKTELHEQDEIITGILSCPCGRSYPIIDGVLDFHVKEQEFANNWADTYKSMDYEELDSKVERQTPANAKEINETIKQYITRELNQNKPQVILDIASGRGMLSTHIAKHIEYEPMFILSDLSFPVLKYDRLKLKKINPKLRANFIACDCSKLPLKDKSIDNCVSFYGIVNMCDIAKAGIEESRRVLKEQGLLLNTAIAIDCETEVAKEYEKAFREQYNIYSFKKTSSMEGLQKLHQEAGFDAIEIITLGEGIGEKNELDAVPIEGEWFAMVLMRCKNIYNSLDN